MNWQQFKFPSEQQCVWLPNLKMEGDDRCFIGPGCARSVSLYVCFRIQDESSGASEGRRTCGERRRGKESAGESRSRPFPIEQAIGWSAEARGTVSGWKGQRLIGGWGGQVRDL